MQPASHSTSRLSTAGRLERRTGPFRPYQWRKCLFLFCFYSSVWGLLAVGRAQRGKLVVGGGVWLIAGGAIYMYRATRQQGEGRPSDTEEDGCTQSG